MSESTLREQLKARELMPHQVEFVETALDSRPAGRILLADDVGLGKTHGCVALAWALARTLGREPRMLILTPRVDLMRQWQSRLIESGSAEPLIVDAAAYRKLEARTRRDENPWMAVGTALCTIDFVKREERLAWLVEAPWDLVILEESHQATSRSQRGRVLRALWDSDLVGLMVAESATPHTGRAEDFEPFAAPTTRILRREARDLLDWDGNPLIPDSAEQIVEVIPLEFSPEERELYEAVARLASEVFPDDRPHRLLTRTLARRAMSSLFALEGTARRLLAKANMAAHGVDRQAALFDDEENVPADAEVLDEGGESELVHLLMDREEIRRILELIDRVEVDTKWSTLADVLRPEVVDKNGSAVIFSDFLETVAYLAELLESLGCPVARVESRQTDLHNQEQYESFRKRGGVLVVTTSASEGLSLPFVKLSVHYDLPWNQAQFAQRLGRIRRYGATPGPVRHVAFSDEILSPRSTTRNLLSISNGGGPGQELKYSEIRRESTARADDEDV